MPTARHSYIAVACVSIFAAGCAAKMIPNTRIQDTPDNREILILVSQYRDAYQARDAHAIAELASDRYLDKRAGISKSVLENSLQEDFDRVRELQLEINVHRITVEGDRAQLDYFYSTSYLLKTPDATWETKTDDKRMELERDSDGWKVVNGL